MDERDDGEDAGEIVEISSGDEDVQVEEIKVEDSADGDNLASSSASSYRYYNADYTTGQAPFFHLFILPSLWEKEKKIFFILS